MEFDHILKLLNDAINDAIYIYPKMIIDDTQDVNFVYDCIINKEKLNCFKKIFNIVNFGDDLVLYFDFIGNINDPKCMAKYVHFEFYKDFPIKKIKEQDIFDKNKNSYRHIINVIIESIKCEKIISFSYKDNNNVIYTL